MLLYIHRNHFARALLECPNNPLRSPYAPSFLASYRNATMLLRVLRRDYAQHPNLYLRNWPVWTRALAASVSLSFFVGLLHMCAQYCDVDMLNFSVDYTCRSLWARWWHAALQRASLLRRLWSCSLRSSYFRRLLVILLSDLEP